MTGEGPAVAAGRLDCEMSATVTRIGRVRKPDPVSEVPDGESDVLRCDHMGTDLQTPNERWG